MNRLHALLMQTDDRPGIWSLYAWCSDIHQRAADWFRKRALSAFGRRRR